MPTARSTPSSSYSKSPGATQRVPNKAARVMDGLRRRIGAGRLWPLMAL